LIVVIAIIATLAGVVAPALFGNVTEARRAAARSQLEIFSLALDAYRLDVGHYPSTDEGLAALRARPTDSDRAARWRGPYLRHDVPPDPWTRSWIYRRSDSPDRPEVEIYTLGRDGQIGGEGEDADITSWRGPVTP
jgi:general secretion pathway protein G